ncbi:MAG: lipid-A-disaccharide synthase, partial [Thermodesulfobacteriota bacterium]
GPAGAAAQRATRPTVLLVAGEASGDLRGAELVRALRDLVPDVRVVGVGGEKLRAAGMEVLVDAAELSTMGVTELLGRVGSIVRSYRRVRGAITGRDGAGRPDLVVLIDFPDFNLRLAKVARRAGIPVLYYVSPQVWAWRRYRVRTLAKRVDHLAVVFPFEAELYRGLAPVTFVGHPALETVRAARDPAQTRARHGLAPERPLVALLPGSRGAEVRELLPVMVEAVARLGVQAAVALAHESLRPLAESFCPAGMPIVCGETYDLVAAADVVLLASGSATLETALLERPMVVMYRLAPVTYALARMLVRVPFIGMPNLVLGKKAVPELIQNEVTAERVAAEARRILDDPELAARIRADLAEVRSLLGEPGAARRAARIAAGMLARGL